MTRAERYKLAKAAAPKESGLGPCYDTRLIQFVQSGFTDEASEFLAANDPRVVLHDLDAIKTALEVLESSFEKPTFATHEEWQDWAINAMATAIVVLREEDQ